MKRILNIINSLTITCCLCAPMSITSCSKKTMYSKPKHLAPYLHEITYDDYRYDANEETTKGSGDASFGCSSVRKGDFYGRNFDYVFNDTPEFIVHVKANEKKHRHESIGVATHFGLREQKFLDGKYGSKDIELIPNLTLDGINDAGLICSHNVVSMEPLEDGLVPETNPGAPNKLHQLFIPRYILDNAASVDEAIGLLKKENLNIQGSLNNEHFLHIMISDKTKTAVVEFFHKTDSAHNHFDVVEKYKNINPETFVKGQEPIMTNYYVNNYEEVEGEYQDNYYFTNDEKNGDERFEILKDGYKSVDSVASMRNLMQKVKFSIACDFLHNPVPMNVHNEEEDGSLNSEWYSESVKQSDLYPSDVEFDWREAQAGLREFKEEYWKAISDDDRSTANPAYWITTHNSTYDMSTLSLVVSVQENYLKTFNYSLKKTF